MELANNSTYFCLGFLTFIFVVVVIGLASATWDFLSDAWNRRKPAKFIPRPEIEWFAEQMEKKLRKNDHKGGWQNDNHWDLYARIDDECMELSKYLCDLDNLHPDDVKGLAEDIVKEAADVANFAMMIADNARRMVNDLPS